ncbi:MAG: hypothetical protein U0446_06735 [Dehalococcoidia bacterium]
MTDSEAREPRQLRLALLALAGLGLAGTAVELVLERHWDGLEQLVPWPFLAAGVVSLVLLSIRPGAASVRVARLLAAALFIGASVGIWRHVAANYDAGFLDFRYADRWPSMSGLDRWWHAATKSVGPAPVLAPGVLAQVGLALLFATVRHPALRSHAEEKSTIG